MQLPPNATTRHTPVIAMKILRRDDAAPKFDGRFHYRGAIETLLSQKHHVPQHCVHQSLVCTILRGPKSASWRCSQKFGQITSSDQKNGLILDPKNTRSLEAYVDYYFSGNWHKTTAPEYVSTAKLRMGYTIMYAGCSIVWAYKLQTHISLITSEAEYLALSQSFWYCIPVMLII